MDVWNMKWSFTTLYRRKNEFENNYVIWPKFYICLNLTTETSEKNRDVDQMSILSTSNIFSKFPNSFKQTWLVEFFYALTYLLIIFLIGNSKASHRKIISLSFVLKSVKIETLAVVRFCKYLWKKLCYQTEWLPT